VISDNYLISTFTLNIWIMQSYQPWSAFMLVRGNNHSGHKYVSTIIYTIISAQEYVYIYD